MSSDYKCFAVVLAAGRASRFGDSKLLETINNVSLVERAVQLAARACGRKSLLVVGHDRQRVRQAAGTAVAAHIINDRYSKGLSTSIVSAVEALEHCADCILILLADQVAITDAHVQDMLNAFDGQTTIATRYAGSVGPPAIFPRSQFEALKDLTGDAGAKQLLTDGSVTVNAITFEDAAIDIDTRDDLDGL